MSGARRLAFTVVTVGAVAAGCAQAPDERKSGSHFMSPQSRAMQADDFANPGMLWVAEGEALWSQKAGEAGQSCADCHGPGERMKGVAARYPAYDAATKTPIDLDGRIEQCRTTRQKAAAFGRESRELLSLAAYIGRQSRGLPLSPDRDPRLEPFRRQGEAIYQQRLGQLNLSCANCHDDNWGRSLGGAPIPQGHPTGYPLYRLEWQSLGSLQRRLRNCMIGVRAEPFDAGSAQMIAMELYLAGRAAGMAIETPAVRP